MASRQCVSTLLLVAVGGVSFFSLFRETTIGGNSLMLELSPLEAAPGSAVSASSNFWGARLYESIGHDRFAGYDGMPDDDLAPLTRWAQQLLTKHQFPAGGCKGVPMLISRAHCDNGIGALTHFVGDHLAIAFGAGRVLVMAPDTCGAWTDPVTCPGKNSFFTCFTRPLSSCSYEEAIAAGSPVIEGYKDHENLTAAIVPPGALWTKPTWWKSVAHVPAIMRDALLEQRPGMKDMEVKYWWRAQASGFILRLNDATIAALRAMRLSKQGRGSLVVTPTSRIASLGLFPFPAGTISSHMRMGWDKKDEMRIVALKEYMDAAEALVQMSPNAVRRSIFLSSETQSAIDQAHAQTNFSGSPWTVMSSNILRVVNGPGGAKLNMSGEMIKHLPPPSIQSQGETTQSHLLNLLMALEADHFIGTRGSNWCRLIDELRCSEYMILRESVG
jgi:hypothetical protein